MAHRGWGGGWGALKVMMVQTERDLKSGGGTGENMVGEQGALASFCLPLSAPHLIDVSLPTVYGKAPPGALRGPQVGTSGSGTGLEEKHEKWSWLFSFLDTAGSSAL